MSILVTGATGNVGSFVVQGLRAKQVPLVAAVQDVAKARQSLGADVPLTLLDFTDPATYLPALNGITTLFLVRPPAISDVKKHIFPFIEAARQSGVSHVVFLSLMGVESNTVTPHYKIEQYLRATGIPFTFLRPSFFMQNLDTTHRDDIREHGEILVPAGRGKTSFIDTRDIAAVALKVLTEPGHTNKAYELSGSEALDYYEVAQIFTRVLGKPVKYSNPGILSFVHRMRQRNFPFNFILVMIALYSVARLGYAAKVTDTLEKLLGHPPTTIAQYIRDYQDKWK
jgi:uncharacterized protein YbjT (DUF2867 family)